MAKTQVDDTEMRILQQRLQQWSREFPNSAFKALRKSGDKIKRQVQAKVRGNIRSNRLPNAITVTVKKQIDGSVDAVVKPKKERGGFNLMRLVAFERGAKREIGKRHRQGYIVVGGRVRWLTRKRAKELEDSGHHVFRRKVYIQHLKARPSFKPVRKAMLPDVRQALLQQALLDWQQTKKTVGGVPA